MDLEAIAVYVKVVQAGSFSGAARLLDMPNTTVSAKVARLEKSLGVTLIQRTTRKLRITPAGQAYFERCRRGLAEIETGEAELTAATGEPRGLLRLTASGEVAHSLLPPIIGRYLGAYPQVKVDIVVASRVVNLVGEGVDLAIRAGELKDSTLVARSFIPVVGGLWASAGYLARRGAPHAPAELEEHDFLFFSRPGMQFLRLGDGRETVDLSLKPRLASDDLETLHTFVRQGAGIGPLPDFLARDSLGDGKLVRVLPQWAWTTGSLSFVYPKQPFVPLNVRAFIDSAIEFVRAAQDPFARERP